MLKEMIENSDEEFFIQDTENYYNRYIKVASFIKSGMEVGITLDSKDVLDRNIHGEVKELIYDILDLSFKEKYVISNSENKILISSFDNKKIFMLEFDKDVNPLKVYMKNSDGVKTLYSIVKQDYVLLVAQSKIDNIRNIVEVLMEQLDEFCMNVIDIIKQL